MNKFSLLAIALVAASAGGFSTASADGSRLFANQYLFPGQRLSAPSCFYHLDMQADGNLVLYPASSGATWASNTVNRGAYAVMQADGNLVVYNWNGGAVWSSGTWGRPGAFTAMQNDGNLVVYSGSSPLWSTGTYGESLGQSPCHYPSSVTTSENAIDRPGNDFVSYYMNRPSPTDCAYWCSKDTRCRAYTFVPPGVQGPQARCWLKDRVPVAVNRPGMVSGLVQR